MYSILLTLLVVPQAAPPASPLQPTDMEHWADFAAEAQVQSLATLLQVLAPRMEMDVCYKGELLLRAKSPEVVRAILGTQPALPIANQVVARGASQDNAHALYCIPDYARALAPWGGELSLYDCWVYGHYQAQVLDSLRRMEVSTVIVPALLDTPGRTAADLALYVNYDRDAGPSPAGLPNFAELFAAQATSGQPTLEQVLALGKYGALLVHALSRSDVELSAEWSVSLLQVPAAAALSQTPPRSALALAVPVSRPGDPRLPDGLLRACDEAGRALFEVQWNGERLYLQWWSSVWGVDQVLERLDFDLCDLARYLFGKKEPAEREHSRWQFLYQSWIQVVETAPALPLAAARFLPLYLEAEGTQALQSLLARSPDFVFNAEGLPANGKLIPALEYLQQCITARGYPAESSAAVRAINLKTPWQPPMQAPGKVITDGR